MENLTHMAVGFADGTVLVYKGDITRDRYKFQVMMSFPLYEAKPLLSSCKCELLSRIMHWVCNFKINSSPFLSKFMFSCCKSSAGLFFLKAHKTENCASRQASRDRYMHKSFQSISITIIYSKCIIGTVTFCWCELAGLAFKQTSDGVILFVVTAEAVLSYSLSAKDRRVRHKLWSLIIFYIINLIWIIFISIF